MSDNRQVISEGRLPILLRESAPRLRSFINSRFPERLRAMVAVDDILQEVWIDAFRTLPGVRLQGTDALDRWLATIARRKLMNKITEFQRIKRGGAKVLRQHVRGRASSFVDLFTMIATTDRTPSSAAANSESAMVVRIAIAGLSDDYRQAIQLRFIEGHPPEAVARLMNKPLPVVRGLIFRGLRKMQAELGEACRFWSDIPSEPQTEFV